jgi:hypothetical protein
VQERRSGLQQHDFLSSLLLLIFPTAQGYPRKAFFFSLSLSCLPSSPCSCETGGTYTGQDCGQFLQKKKSMLAGPVAGSFFFGSYTIEISACYLGRDYVVRFVYNVNKTNSSSFSLSGLWSLFGCFGVDAEREVIASRARRVI